MNRTINIALKIGLVFVSFVLGAMISCYLLLLRFFGFDTINLAWFMMIVTAFMVGLSYAFLDTFSLFNSRHRFFRRFIQFLLFQLILSFLASIGLGFSVERTYWRMMYHGGQGWPILDPRLDALIQLSIVLLSTVAITAAARIIFQALYRVPINFIKSLVLFLTIILLMLQMTITWAFGYTSISCISSITCQDKNSFSPDRTREIRWIEIQDNTNNRRFLDGSVRGSIYITKITDSPVWKAIYGYQGADLPWGDGVPLYQEFIWSKDSSKVYIVAVHGKEFDRKGIYPASIWFGYDFRSDRKIPPETACSDYREIPDLILPNETCPQKPEPENR